MKITEYLQYYDKGNGESCQVVFLFLLNDVITFFHCCPSAFCVVGIGISYRLTLKVKYLDIYLILLYNGYVCFIHYGNKITL